jgi:hypothetical protein
MVTLIKSIFVLRFMKQALELSRILVSNLSSPRNPTSVKLSLTPTIYLFTYLFPHPHGTSQVPNFGDPCSRTLVCLPYWKQWRCNTQTTGTNGGVTVHVPSCSTFISMAFPIMGRDGGPGILSMSRTMWALLFRRLHHDTKTDTRSTTAMGLSSDKHHISPPAKHPLILRRVFNDDISAAQVSICSVEWDEKRLYIYFFFL